MTHSNPHEVSSLSGPAYYYPGSSRIVVHVGWLCIHARRDGFHTAQWRPCTGVSAQSNMRLRVYIERSTDIRKTHRYSVVADHHGPRKCTMRIRKNYDTFDSRKEWVAAPFATLLGCSRISTAVQGLGGGGISTTTAIIVSDLVPLKERGVYKGLIGM